MHTHQSASDRHGNAERIGLVAGVAGTAGKSEGDRRSGRKQARENEKKRGKIPRPRGFLLFPARPSSDASAASAASLPSSPVGSCSPACAAMLRCASSSAYALGCFTFMMARRTWVSTTCNNSTITAQQQQSWVRFWGDLCEGRRGELHIVLSMPARFRQATRGPMLCSRGISRRENPSPGEKEGKKDFESPIFAHCWHQPPLAQVPSCAP